MARQHIYTVMSGNEMNWDVIKMERDFEHVETYHISKHVSVCSCYAGSKPTCRHRELLSIFKMEDAIDSRRAYDYDKAKWIEPPKAALETM
jgi:hypothetical protein